MDLKAIALFVICIIALSVAGCTTHSPEPAGPATIPVSLSPEISATPITPVQPAECTRDEDCVPAGCCHPSGCTAAAVKPACNLMCTASCEGPLDCGAGSCSCEKGKCSVVPASSTTPATPDLTSITINATPQRYSPLMSSTPGIGLEPVITGFDAGNATFTWKTTYGRFFSWSAPGFTVDERGDSASNHGEKLYWSFIDKPSSTTIPVTITATATDSATGRLLGSSTVTLEWADNYFVTVKKIE
ncbi:MAG: hypothetical protein WC379_11520 [Methanoregula sp.]